MPATRLCLVAVAALAVATAARAQQPALPKPGPEHEHLKQLVGTWDCTVKMGGMQSKGKSVYQSDLSGLWVISTFDGDFAGAKFQGHGIDGYDNAKKKYVGVWVDSMETSLLVTEGTYDKAAKTLTMRGKGPGQDGTMTEYTMKTQWKNKDTFVFSLLSRDKQSGKDVLVMTIDYQRAK